jgi:spore coat polysaccharide biosynthesis protein SpsF (cytidylyltransferase family)
VRVIGVIQARMGSSRLPGKVLADLAGEPMLGRVTERLAAANCVNEVIVATSNEPADDVVAHWCTANGRSCFRGSANDVLDRYCRAADEFAAEAVVRITADCPFIDAGVVDSVVEAFLSGGPVDYASNVLPPRTFPRGLDTEVLTRAALLRACRSATEPADREHVTRYLIRHPDEFLLLGVWHDHDLSGWRWTVDTPEDLAFARQIYGHFDGSDFGWRDVLGALADHPSWADINRHIDQKAV